MLQEKGRRHQTNEFYDTCPEKSVMNLVECYQKYHIMLDYKKINFSFGFK